MMALGIASGEAAQDDKIGRAVAERHAGRPGCVVRVGLRDARAARCLAC